MGNYRNSPVGLQREPVWGMLDTVTTEERKYGWSYTFQTIHVITIIGLQLQYSHMALDDTGLG